MLNGIWSCDIVRWWHPTSPDGPWKNEGLRLLIGSKWKASFLLLSKVVTNCRKRGRGASSTLTDGIGVFKFWIHTGDCLGYTFTWAPNKVTRWVFISHAPHWESLKTGFYISSTQWQANFEKKSPPLGTAICFLLQQKFYQKTLPLQLLSGRRRATRSTHHDPKITGKPVNNT